MRWLNIRTLLTVALSLLLASFGVYLGLQLPHFNGIPTLYIPSGEDLIKTSPAYQATTTVMLALVGLLLGFYLGPRLGEIIVRAGRSLEMASPADKIAVFIGTVVGVVVTYPFYNLLSTITIFVRVFLLVFISVVLVYLGIVAAMSMKAELLAILSRGGAAAPAIPETVETSPTLNCKILDTNVIIDGRIADVCRAGFLEGPLYVPGFVLEELQHIADSGDGLKRARGRRGLDILNSMKQELPLIVRVWDKALDKSANDDEVDTRLVKLAKALEGMIVTNDFNLNKVAALQGVQVLNVNELANALKPVVLPGEAMTVGIVKEGKEANQGVAYLDDGTMIVVEDGRRYLNSTLSVIVTSVLQTVAGKMIFARVRDDEGDAFEHNSLRSDSNGNGSGGSSGFTRRGTSKKIR
ncbi:MAG: Integral rane protein domain superfamily [Chthonomonadales bacterium]|nr:Integral rane protein domain superfamily [Chthonomonadales bacterium]